MSDIVEEARAMLAYSPNSRLVDVVSALADECERLSASLDAMTNQAVMASGRRATIVTEDGELERLRTENARLREAMPTDDGDQACFCCGDVLLPEVPLCERCVHGCDEDDDHRGRDAVDRERVRLLREQDARLDAAKEVG